MQTGPGMKTMQTWQTSTRRPIFRSSDLDRRSCLISSTIAIVSGCWERLELMSDFGSILNGPHSGSALMKEHCDSDR